MRNRLSVGSIVGKRGRPTLGSLPLYRRLQKLRALNAVRKHLNYSQHDFLDIIQAKGMDRLREWQRSQLNCLHRLVFAPARRGRKKRD